MAKIRVTPVPSSGRAPFEVEGTLGTGVLDDGSVVYYIGGESFPEEIVTVLEEETRLELRECPFCGGEAKYIGECDMVGVECTSCGATCSGWWDEPEDAAAEWNSRYQPKASECADCSGIVYRQTNSKKLIPMDCKHVLLPSCFEQATGYNDNRCLGMSQEGDDEPIERCKQCPYNTCNERCCLIKHERKG